MSNIGKAFETLKQGMTDDELAHVWHCNIAMACYDAIMDSGSELTHEEAHKVGNDAASRFMEVCFGVDTGA